ncbi:MAG: hypothetical protein H6670_14015 [Anaerolineaceae bacterium]|nr:hypothetical protein [Anaerolineaceae bacterium]
MAYRKQSYVLVFFSLLIFVMAFLSLAAWQFPIAASAAIALFWTVLSAVVMAGGFAFREWQQRRAFVGKKQARDNATTHQQTRIEVDLPRLEAFSVALAVVNDLDGQPIPQPEGTLNQQVDRVVGRKQRLRLQTADAAKGQIVADLRVQSFGLTDVVPFSRITIQLRPIDAVTTAIEIQSDGRWMAEIYDLGRNLHYVNQLARTIRQQSQQATAIDHLVEADEMDTETKLDIHQQKTDENRA